MAFKMDRTGKASWHFEFSGWHAAALYAGLGLLGAVLF